MAMLQSPHGSMEIITSAKTNPVITRSGAQCYYVADTPIIDTHRMDARAWSGPYPSASVALMHAATPSQVKVPFTHERLEAFLSRVAS